MHLLLYFWGYFLQHVIKGDHLKAGFQSPDDVIVWRRDLCSRWTDNRQKATPSTARMTTPEIRPMVTGFIGCELAGDAVKWRFENRHFINPSIILHELASIHHLLGHLVNYHKLVLRQLLCTLTKLGVVDRIFIWKNDFTEVLSIFLVLRMH